MTKTMIDFIKLNITDGLRFEEHLTNNKLIELRTFLNSSTGVVELYPKYGKYLNLDIKVNPKHSKISGSLHKFENLCFLGENHNYNDFTYNELSSQIPMLEEIFDLQYNNSLSYLELGFNIKLDFDPQSLIDDNILMYNFKSHQKDLKFNGNGDYKEFIKRDYSIKIYNKSKQYKKQFNIEEHILRIELKIKTKRKIQSFDVYCLNDLLDKNKIYNVFEFLYKEFEKLTIIDHLNFDELPEKDKEKLNRYTNPNYWQRLRTENKSYKVQNRLKNDFNLIINKNKLNTLKEDLKYKLVYKFWELINYNEKELFEPINIKG